MRRHLSDKVPVSELAESLEVQPSQIHLWVKQVLDQAEKAFQRPKASRARKGEDAKTRRIAQLEAKLAVKNEVISELMEEVLKAKKANGEMC